MRVEFGVPNDRKMSVALYYQDTPKHKSGGYRAAAYMQLIAWELGIGSCLASIYAPDKARGILGFPQELFLKVAISFGYPQDADVLTNQPKKTGRKPLCDILHWNRW